MADDIKNQAPAYAHASAGAYTPSASSSKGEHRRQLHQTVAALLAAFKDAGRNIAAGVREGRENAERAARP